MHTAIKRPRTASKAKRRRQLIEATIHSIATRGISGTTMASVTSRANLSMGIVSFHFQSKENLMKETLMFLVEEHREFWIRSLRDPDLSPSEKLRSVVEANFHPSICTPERISVWFAFFGEARYRKTYREKVSQFDTERAEVMEQICRTIIDEGDYGPLDAATIAKSIECFSDGLWLSLMMSPEWLSLTEAKALVYGFLAQTFPKHFPTAEGVPAPLGA